MGENSSNQNKNNNSNGTNKSSVISKKPQEIVFVVKNNKVKSVPVQTGISDNNYIEVTSGLKGGEEVVSGSYRAIARELNNDSDVRVEKNSPNPTANQN